MSLPNHYKTLGVPSSATLDEIKRSYRILARRYHPDVNPEQSSQDRFKLISDAYKVLTDPKLRADYDFALGQQRYRSHDSDFYNFMREADKRKKNPNESQDKIKSHRSSASTTNGARRGSTNFNNNNNSSSLQNLWQKMHQILTWEIPILTRKKKVSTATKVSVLEVSLSTVEAMRGIKKVVEYEEDGSKRRVSVSIPAGSRNGSIIRLRRTGHSKITNEELIVIPRIAPHPYITLDSRGVTIEIPITVYEAVNGASITVPTFEDQKVLKIPQGTQSGYTLRLKERGISRGAGETRGDLLYRFIVHIPESQGAVGLTEVSTSLDEYYSQNVRHELPTSLPPEGDD